MVCPGSQAVHKPTSMHPCCVCLQAAAAKAPKVSEPATQLASTKQAEPAADKENFKDGAAIYELFKVGTHGSALFCPPKTYP